MQGSPLLWHHCQNNNNACVLFATVGRLTNPPVSVAPGYESIKSSNEYRKLDKLSVPPYHVEGLCCLCVHLNPIKLAWHNLRSLIPSNIWNPPPATLIFSLQAFFKNIFKHMVSDFLRTVNIFLPSGYFPQALETAVTNGAICTIQAHIEHPISE